MVRCKVGISPHILPNNIYFGAVTLLQSIEKHPIQSVSYPPVSPCAGKTYVAYIIHFVICTYALVSPFFNKSLQPHLIEKESITIQLEEINSFFMR